MKGKTTCNEDKKEGMLYKLILVLIQRGFVRQKRKSYTTRFRQASHSLLPALQRWGKTHVILVLVAASALHDHEILGILGLSTQAPLI